MLAQNVCTLYTQVYIPFCTSALFIRGASEGSNFSWIFCSSTGVPDCMQASSTCRKFGCCRSMMLRFCGSEGNDHSLPVLNELTCFISYPLLLHVFNPLQRLSLWINHEGPPTNTYTQSYTRRHMYIQRVKFLRVGQFLPNQILIQYVCIC